MNQTLRDLLTLSFSRNKDKFLHPNNSNSHFDKVCNTKTYFSLILHNRKARLQIMKTSLKLRKPDKQTYLMCLPIWIIICV